MRVDVLWTPAEWAGIDPQGRVAVVIDVLRSTSTIVTALANDARAILPTASTEQALQIARTLGRDGVLLCGEQRNARIEGFDLGNSPSEFRREVVEGRTLVLCTTNGTRALLTPAGARSVLIASFLNLGAVVRHLLEERADPLFVCAGRAGLVGLDDVLCAGEAVARLVSGSARVPRRRFGRRDPRRGEKLELGDGAVAAHVLWASSMPIRAQTLAETAAGRALRAAGFADDVAACARQDVVDLVPALEDRKIVVKTEVRTLRTAGRAGGGDVVGTGGAE